MSDQAFSAKSYARCVEEAALVGEAVADPQAAVRRQSGTGAVARFRGGPRAGQPCPDVCVGAVDPEVVEEPPPAWPANTTTPRPATQRRRVPESRRRRIARVELQPAVRGEGVAPEVAEGRGSVASAVEVGPRPGGIDRPGVILACFRGAGRCDPGPAQRARETTGADGEVRADRGRRRREGTDGGGDVGADEAAPLQRPAATRGPGPTPMRSPTRSTRRPSRPASTAAPTRAGGRGSGGGGRGPPLDRAQSPRHPPWNRRPQSPRARHQPRGGDGEQGERGMPAVWSAIRDGRMTGRTKSVRLSGGGRCRRSRAMDEPTATALAPMESATAATSATYMSDGIVPAATRADASTKLNSPIWPRPTASCSGRAAGTATRAST